MRRFENFSPTIPEEITTGPIPSDTIPIYENVVESKNNNAKRKPTASRKGKKEVQKEKKESHIGEKLNRFFNSQTLRWIMGLFMGFFAVYLAVAFLSYFTACISDQSEINHTAIGSAGSIANAGGEGGARLSEFLINEFFGLGSFVIIVWLFVIGLRLLTGKPRLKPLNFTIKCLVGLITLSLIVGLLTIGLQSSVNWGGYHGRYVNEFIIHFLGWTGAVILCLFMVCCFVLICMRDVLKWGMAKRAKYLEKKREREELRREQLEREREIEEMRRFEDVTNGVIPPNDDEMSQPQSTIVSPEMEFGEDDKLTYEGLDETNSHEFDTYSIEDQDEEDSIPENHEKEPMTQQNEGETPDEMTKEPTLEMVVNVNDISQVNVKKPSVSGEGPEHFPYKFPPFDLLREGETKVDVDAEEQLDNKEKIRRTLLDFDIPIINIEATVGPTVTLYEIVPDKGVRVSKIRALVDDIALSLSAEGVRIIAPIPGKGTVGIEVANKTAQTVSMRTVLKSTTFQDSKYKLPVAIGSTISNDVYIADLSKMPHLLVAGATGQGKSVGLNAIIASLLYSKRPDELKFVMIDPKMVEFSLYQKIESHYLAKIPDAEDSVITDTDKVVATLSSLCTEMDNRYQLLKEASTRNVIEYNEKIKDKKLNPEHGHRYMPYIVVIVDEFSDLIMTAGKEVEMPIARLAQKARAVGIHVIVATQRPSTNVITGIIKANFPARMAFKVASGVDSKTILDTPGAQQLIGRGDMLISNSAPMVRVQCAFIDTPEVEKICEYIARQPYAQGAYMLPEPTSGKNGNSEGEGGGDITGERDPLFAEVARMVVKTNNASTSSVQRTYSIGYNRAGRIMDQLEAAGVVGPATGGKPRSVIMDPISLESFLDSLGII